MTPTAKPHNSLKALATARKNSRTMWNPSTAQKSAKMPMNISIRTPVPNCPGLGGLSAVAFIAAESEAPHARMPSLMLSGSPPDLTPSLQAAAQLGVLSGCPAKFQVCSGRRTNEVASVPSRRLRVSEVLSRPATEFEPRLTATSRPWARGPESEMTQLMGE